MIPPEQVFPVFLKHKCQLLFLLFIYILIFVCIAQRLYMHLAVLLYFYTLT